MNDRPDNQFCDNNEMNNPCGPRRNRDSNGDMNGPDMDMRNPRPMGPQMNGPQDRPPRPQGPGPGPRPQGPGPNDCGCGNPSPFHHTRRFLTEEEIMIAQDIERVYKNKSNIVVRFLDKCLGPDSFLNAQTVKSINLENFIVLYSLHKDNPEYSDRFNEVIDRIRENYFARKTRIRLLKSEIPTDRDIEKELLRFN